MTAIPVTDADREAAAKAVEMGEAWLPLLFAKTRAEGAASERGACAKLCDVWAGKSADLCRDAEERWDEAREAEADAMAATAEELAAAIRARGEGGAK